MARQNTQTNNQVFIESANARAMPCHSRVYCRKPAVHPALGSSPADRSCCRCRAEPLVPPGCPSIRTRELVVQLANFGRFVIEECTPGKWLSW